MTGLMREGVFRKRHETGVEWFRVDRTRYPKEQWWITDVLHLPEQQPKVLMSTRRKLTGEEWAQLEEWL